MRALSLIAVVSMLLSACSLTRCEEARTLQDQYRHINSLLDRGQGKEALVLCRRALPLCVKKYGENAVQTAKFRQLLGDVHQVCLDFAGSLKPYQGALKAAESLDKPDLEIMAKALHGIASAYQHAGDYKRAIAARKRVVAVREKQNNPKSIRDADAYAYLAETQLNVGLLEEAERAAKKALAIFKRKIGPDHFLNNIALLIMAKIREQQGRRREQEQYLMRVIEVNKGATQVDPAVQLSILLSLGRLYSDCGKYHKAVGAYKKALDVMRQIFPPTHTMVLRIRCDLAKAQMHSDQFEPAEKTLNEVIAIARKRHGDNSPVLNSAQISLGILKQYKDDPDAADPHFREAYKRAVRLYGPDSKEVRYVLDGFAGNLLMQGDFKGSEQYYKKWVDLTTRHLGTKHPDTAAAYLKHAMSLAALGRLKDASRTFVSGFRLWLEIRGYLFSSSSEATRYHWLNQHSWAWHTYFGLLPRLQKADPEALTHAATLLLSYKNAILETTIEEQAAAREVGNPKLAAIAGKVANAREKIARILTSDTGPKTRKDRLEELTAELEHGEKELAHLSYHRAQQLRKRKASLDQIRARLTEDTVLISFLTVFPYDFTTHKFRPGEIHGYVLTKSKTPQLHVLCNLEDLASSVKTFKAALPRMGAQNAHSSAAESPSLKSLSALSRHVLVPMWPQIKTYPRWILDPDHVVSLISFASLPIPGDNRPVVMGHEVSYVTNARRVVCFEKGQPGERKVVLLGNPDFNTSAGDVERVQNDSGMFRSLRGNTWPLLPGTKAELSALRTLFKKAKIGVDSYEDAEASKHRLLGVRRPRILHIATHGFFIKNVKADTGGGGRGLAGVVSSVIPSQRKNPLARLMTLDHPLLKSGLVLAGANRKQELLKSLVTAQELTGMDLSQTELVTLSACDTGVGEVTAGRGILGMRSAMMQTGAQRVLMSLWKVPDAPTRDLMISFYKKRLTGMRTAQALREAMVSVRASRRNAGLSTHPYFWGAFVLAGNPD